MSKLIWDFGNARWKWYQPLTKAKGDFRHAIAPLSESEWRGIVGRGLPPQGLARIDGKPYAFGDQARRHTLKERPKGAARYVPDYYGVATAYMLAEVLQRSDLKVSLYASHAPGDIQYAHKLIEAAKREWCVESHWGELHFNIRAVSTFDEPIGGYCHATLNDDGTDKRKNPLASKTVLVVDPGGWTTDVAAVDPGGSIDLLSIKSTRSGTLQMFEDFERDLREANGDLFQSTNTIDPRRIEAAIMTGVFQFGRVAVPCKKEAQEVLNVLVNDTIAIIDENGGAANFDVGLLTGGGGALIEQTLSAALPMLEFVLAEPCTEYMKYANVFGGAKIAELMKAARQAG
jgi:hypothetical protein